MAPVLGYWGNVTSTLDWCEENYIVSHYFAEFWNTISNVAMIFPPMAGAILAYREKLEARFLWCHISLMIVGIGSWLFHMTLLYGMQLMDELPMIWGSSFLVYANCTMSSDPKKPNKPLQIGLFIYCSIVTIVYLINQNPIFHQVAYALMVGAMLSSAVWTIVKYKHSVFLFVLSGVTYFSGFFLWNLDNIFCKHLRYLRREVLGPVGPATEFHAWWHILAGLGTYLSLLFVTHTRYMYLKKNPRIKLLWGIYPLVTIKLDEDAAKQN